MVVVALIGVEELAAHLEALAGLRQALQRGGVQPTARLHLNAAEWGAPTCMGVKILVAEASGGGGGSGPPLAAVRGPVVGTGAGPQHLRSILRAAAAVPTESSLPPRLTPWRGPRTSQFHPTEAARAELGGAEADLFPGALVELTGEQTRPTQPWRVK